MWATLRLTLWLVAAAAALGLLSHSPVVAPTAEGLSQSGKSGARWLRIEVQQDGRTIPVKDHAVLVQRKPFDLVLYLPDKEAVHVRAASQPALYDLAKSGAPLAKIFNPAQTTAYTPFNKDEDMMLDDPTIQDSWWYDSSEKDHTFNEITPVAGGFKCRRRISNFFTNGTSIPVVKTDFDAIYLVFLTGKSSADHLSTIEEQRDFLKIAFAAPASRSAAAGRDTSQNCFSISLEQLRSPIAISGHEARVRKAPFDVLVDLRAIPGVYVHASFENAAFEKARRGDALGSVFHKNQTLALGRLNDKQLLFMNGEDSHQYWYAFSGTQHDFNMLTPVPGGVRGRRVVSNLWIGDGPVLVHRVPQSVLYLVFYAGELSEDADDDAAQRARERQRDVLKITMQ